MTTVKKVYNILIFFFVRLISFVVKIFLTIIDSTINIFPFLRGFPFTTRGPKILSYFIENSYPIINVKSESASIDFYCPGIMPVYRAKTAFTKEPETIEWINNFKKDSIFWDIGANVGVYSLFAGIKNHQVYSFEPSAPNYYVLNKNIEINKLDNQIKAFNIALASENEISHLRMGDTTLGGAFNSFKDPIKESGEAFKVEFNQAIIGFTVDEFIDRYNLSIPNYMKIDVDSIEWDIVKGAIKTFSSKRFKSLLIELSIKRPDYDDIISFLKNQGLTEIIIHSAAFNQNSPIKNHIFSKK